MRTAEHVMSSKLKNKKIVVRNRNQITIPKECTKYVNVGEGEELRYEITDDGALILRPVITVPKNQAWFWTDKWQAEERENDEEIKKRQVSSPQNAEDFINDLKNL
ncbi:MAG TPA: AbrB/MazE/SpoVT family DNA-binding domain-containing protein [Desulfosporosinus sp.]|nr:AbrB/MazE/SpoVT family DNA-binding domain-containing protein [Desulfosporosinus sp.]